MDPMSAPNRPEDKGEAGPGAPGEVCPLGGLTEPMPCAADPLEGPEIHCHLAVATLPKTPSGRGYRILPRRPQRCAGGDPRLAP